MNESLAPSLSMVVDDAAHVEAAIPGMHITRLDRGRNETRLTVVELDTIGLCVGRFDFKVSSEARFEDDDVRIGLQLGEGSGSWNGLTFDRNRLWVYGPNSEHSGAAGPNNHGHGATWVTFTVPLETADATFGPDFLDRHHDLTSVDADLGPLRTSLGDIVTQVGDNTFTTLHARRVERELCEATAAIIPGSDRNTAGSRSSHRITQQCIAVADDLDPIPTSAELAGALGITDRWVRAAFAGAYGVSVSEFFRARALHRARRALAAADPTSTSVTEIAMAYGFWHLGRFSGHYRAHFGELPSRTLGRAA